MCEWDQTKRRRRGIIRGVVQKKEVYWVMVRLKNIWTIWERGPERETFHSVLRCVCACEYNKKKKKKKRLVSRLMPVHVWPPNFACLLKFIWVWTPFPHRNWLYFPLTSMLTYHFNFRVSVFHTLCFFLRSLFGNQLQTLPPGLFGHLSNLHLL